MKLKNKSADIFLVLIFFLAAISISIAGYSMGEFKLIQRASNKFFSQKAMSISSELEFKDYTKNLLSENALFIKSDYNAFWIYFNDKFRIPVTTGRFFTPEDFKSSLPKAIVGKDVDTQLSDDGRNYYLHNGIKYEVIGIAGIKKISWLDSCIYLSALSDLEIKDTSIIIDGTRVDENIRILQKKFDGIIANTLEEAGIARIFKSSGTSFQTVFNYVGLVFILTIISITSFWIMQKKKLIMILKICGISHLNILKTICIEYSKYAVSSFSIGLVFSLIFIRPMFSYQFGLFNNAIYLIAGIICCIIPVLLLNLTWTNRSMGRYQR